MVKQAISLGDVKSAEHYVAQDSASLFLRGRKNSLDIPLWAFSPDAAREIATHVKSRGVNLLSIPGGIMV